MIKTVPIAAYSDERGNVIEYDGDLLEDSSITFRGRNNRAVIHRQAFARGLKVDFNADNGTFILGSNKRKRSFSAGVRVGQDSIVEIGEGVSATGAVVISAVEGTSVRIGNDVMFASQNQLRADDGHPIFDVQTGKRVNIARDINVGGHVWLAWGAVVLGGATIGQGSVLGYGSVTTRNIPNNCVAVGAPSKVVRKNIAWERPHLGLDKPFYKPDASAVQKSEFWCLTAEAGHPVVPYKPSFARRCLRYLRRRWNDKFLRRTS